MSANRIDVAVLGATGVVGQRFVRRLAAHPQFRLVQIAASERSVGKRYDEACAWRLDGEPYGGYGAQTLLPCTPTAVTARVVFSALDTGPAQELEPLFAAASAIVFSNAAAFRMAEDVPLLVPEVNPEHLELLSVQRARRGWSGGIITNPNCTSTVLVMALKPLDVVFGIEAVHMVSMQAISGAGYPGVSALDILGNIIPHIRGEESKVELETVKLLGALRGGAVIPTHAVVSAACHRVPVQEGHTLSVSVRLKGAPTPVAVAKALVEWTPEPQQLKLHSAPQRVLVLHTEEDRPQPRVDVERDTGMSVHIGRIRPCSLFGIKMTVLGHNTERGAAGGSLLNAELAAHKGLLR
ncbi:MAG: aspartate-semialdehyde dehydrogenase [Planctomycetes bacterium]|nr:aspartate-semialdehyde dehydrogenase [Planctomycetota bacterium]